MIIRGSLWGQRWSYSSHIWDRSVDTPEQSYIFWIHLKKKKQEEDEKGKKTLELRNNMALDVPQTPETQDQVQN